MEYRKGCPACDHTDPQLERELKAFAQLLVDSYLEDCGIVLHGYPQGGIDNGADDVRVKEVDNQQISKE